PPGLAQRALGGLGLGFGLDGRLADPALELAGAGVVAVLERDPDLVARGLDAPRLEVRPGLVEQPGPRGRPGVVGPLVLADPRVAHEREHVSELPLLEQS